MPGGDNKDCNYPNAAVHDMLIEQLCAVTADHSAKFSEFASIPLLLEHQKQLMVDIKAQVSGVPSVERRLALAEKELENVRKEYETCKSATDEKYAKTVEPALKFISELQGERKYIRYVAPIITGLLGALLPTLLQKVGAM